MTAGTITPEQFVNLNENIGGLDIDHNFVPRRSIADPGAVATAYRSSVTEDARQLDNVAIIDLRTDTPTIRSSGPSPAPTTHRRPR